MLTNNQYVVYLGRLTLPDVQHVKKLTLSICSQGQEQFIQNQKIVKGNRVNFYRQSIFIASFYNGITFNIYSIDNEGSKQLIHLFKTESSELESINRRAAMFHNSGQGYELVWQCSLFIDQSDQGQQGTDKEYTEFARTFQFPEETVTTDLFAIRNMEDRLNISSEVKGSQHICKRSNSTDDSSIRRDYYGLEIDQIQINSKKKVKDDWNQEIKEKYKKKINKQNKTSQKRSVNIKSLVYSSLITGISGLFSR